MSVRSKKKTRWQRGSRTYGWGRVGQHRRSGTRGGRGHAGYHKHMWTWVVKYAPDWFGKKGFTRPPSLTVKYKVINVGTLSEYLDKWLNKGYVTIDSNGRIIVNLQELGYNKLLGEGEINKPVIVTVLKASKKAIEKIKNAGGEVKILAK